MTFKNPFMGSQCGNYATAHSGDSSTAEADPARMAFASAQRQLMDALGIHLNSGDNRRFADPAWQAQARGLIDLVERSLALGHTSEETRTELWTAVRGYESWLTYHTVLSEPLPFAAPPPGGRRVFDCFQFNDELDLLEIRFAELDPVVERFVVAEAAFTHAGAPKPLHFHENRERFAAYADKIVHVVVEDDPGGFAWRREAHQRNAIARALGDCLPSDLIVVSDADEILRADVVEWLRREPGDGGTLFAPQLDIFLYFLDLMAPDPWVSVAAAPWSLMRRIGPNRARYLAKLGIGRSIPDAGWHFTWMGGVERFRAKMEAFAHREMIAGFDGDAAANRMRLERFYATGSFDDGAVPGMWTGLRRVPLDARYPARMRERLPHFRRLGWLSPSAEPCPEEFLAMGRSLEAAGEGDRADAAYSRAITLDPACIEALHALAELRLGRGSVAGAIRLLRGCAALDPWGVYHRFKLAHSLLTLRRHVEAEGVLRDLLRRDPQDHAVHGNLAVALKNQGRYAEAEAAGRRTLALAPDQPGAYGNLGIALSLQSDRGVAAARALSCALILDPLYLDARMNLAILKRDLHRLDEAEAECRRIIDAQPDHAAAHTLLATCLLTRGEFASGFAAYEWRTRLLDDPAAAHGLPSPAWDGTDPAGRTILLHDEQGFGDSIQFARFASELARRGARVVLRCREPLVRLFATVPGVEQAVADSAPPPPHDAWASLLSLPHRLGTTVATIPADVPYLIADPQDVEAWRSRLVPAGGRAGGRLVGLVWAGNPDQPVDRKRSVALETLLPLFEVAGATIVPLQMGPARKELDGLRHRLPPGLPASLMDPVDSLKDFADTAALVTALDLVIAVDTAVAHLAGSLGVPVWTLLRYESEWRWMLDLAESPWYPTMRLFRQKRAGDWAGVAADLRAALHEWTCAERRTGAMRQEP